MYMHKDNSMDILLGFAAGALALVGVAFVLKKACDVGVIDVEKVKKIDEKLVKQVRTFAKKSTVKVSKLVKQKKQKALDLLKYMKKATHYTQVELVKLTSIPYRSVRRYVDELIKEGKLLAKGYGKGKKFVKA